MKRFTRILLAIYLCVTASAEKPSVVLPAKHAGITGGAAYDANGDIIGSSNGPGAKVQWEVSIDEPGSATIVMPNFHPASCGWLTDWSTERVYCANSYLAHLDRVRDDPHFGFSLSEVNNMIAIMNFAPERFEEIKRRIKEGRVEAVNAFFLEPTINLSGGEALAKMGIEGLRWQQEVLGVRPSFSWMIDVCGVHDQMPQICTEPPRDSNRAFTDFLNRRYRGHSNRL